MVDFFEYMFYRLYWYDVIKMRFFTPREGLLSAVILMGFLLGMNYVFITEGFCYLFILDYKPGSIPYKIPLTIIIALCYYYFSRKGRKEEIVNYWQNKASKDEKFMKDIKFIAYIVLTLVALFWLWFYVMAV